MTEKRPRVGEERGSSCRSDERGEGGWTAVKAVKYQSRDGSCHRRANIMGGVLN